MCPKESIVFQKVIGGPMEISKAKAKNVVKDVVYHEQ